MGVEVAVNGEAQAQLHGKENGKVDAAEPLKVGSHTADEQQAKGELAAHPPKNVAEEWPEPPQVHYFWIVKYRLYEDPKLKAEIDKIDREVQRIDRRKTELYEQINPKQKERDEVSALLKPLNSENFQYVKFMSEKRSKMKPLQDALGTLHGPGRGGGLPTSEKELDEHIRGLEYSIQHESISLKEEKQLIKKIKELEATRPKMIANDQVRAKIQESLGQKEVIQDQVELLGSDLDGVRKQWSDLKPKRDQLYAQDRALYQQLDPLYAEVKDLNEKKKDLIAALRELRKKRDEGNSCFYQNRTDINKAKALAAQKDVKSLEKFVDEEVEKFMKDWNNSKVFRGDYEKRILMSLDQRQLSRDGRMRNPDEKPLVMTEAPRPSVGKELPKAAAKPQKEDSKPTTKAAEDLPAPKAQKESKQSSKESKIAPAKPVEEDDFFVVEKPKKDLSKENEIDKAKLREMKKEEEKEKQRQALERKKKLQERAAAKAAFIAQKEAEKKQTKEREKKLKKKGAATEEEPAEQEAEAVELEKIDNAEELVETSTSRKAKEPKENAVRLRKQVKTRGALPKAILKKKKSANYWVWGGAAAAAAVVLMLLMIGYNYFF